MLLLDNGTYLLLILFILAVIYLGWEVKERNKFKSAENTKNRNVYIPGDLVSGAYFGSRFSIKLTFMTARNLLRLTIYIIYNLTAIQYQSNSHLITTWCLLVR